MSDSGRTHGGASPKVAYVAGPYRSEKGSWAVLGNVHMATRIARDLWLRGYAAICPHANTFMMDGVDLTDMDILGGDLEIVRRCDLVVLCPAWRQSRGARVEVLRAREHRIPVYEWVTERPEPLKLLRVK